MADETDQEQIKNMADLLKKTGGSMPSKKELLEMLETSEMNEELKENLRSMLKGNAPELFGGYGGGSYLAILFVFILLSIIFFFGYKLYKSIKDKELKKEEKKKLKQMKKKK